MLICVWLEIGGSDEQIRVGIGMEGGKEEVDEEGKLESGKMGGGMAMMS